ncbi:hypothetical protein B0H11DRAFT_2320084 [Mycena galericulata]|nr:hypothetical protein B0H11DRAFT_2320084 [Mycena galericulata]
MSATTQLELRISAASLTTSPPNTNDIRLISGPLHDFLALSRLEHAKWLIDIAHDICDPAARRGSLCVWDAGTQQLLPVAPADPLVAAVYRYIVPGGLGVGLSKISEREGRSKSGDGPGRAMAERVKRRDGRCWVAPVYGRAVTNSHIVPKRMGDHLACAVVNTFAPPSAPILNLSIYDEIFGICLSRTLAAYFVNYELGLRFVSQNQYECHVFAAASPGRALTIYGETDAREPILHGHPASPPFPHAKTPPPGLLRWHYLQCVLRRFAHTDYTAYPGIVYPALPLRMEGDSDSDLEEEEGGGDGQRGGEGE